MIRLIDLIAQNAAQYPDKTAAVYNGEHLSYADLLDKIDAESAVIMRSDDYAKGSGIVVKNTQNADFIVRYFAIHKAGCVAVPVEKDIPEARLEQITRIVAAENFSDEIADVLFTTGTTGMSKGVMISHRTIIANAENLIDAQGFAHDVTFVVNGPLNHIGSLSKIYPTLLVGGTLYIIDGMKDMNVFFKAFDYPSEKMATFLVPASIRMLVQFSSRQLSAIAHKIDFVETGAAPISQADMEKLCALLPNSRLYNTYASTETGIIATHNYNSDVCVAGCLGKAMKHSKFFITDEGSVACSGDTLMSGYIGDSEMTARVMRNGVIYTADCGRIDECGRLHLTGRADDIINVGGFKVSPSEVEDAVMAFDGIADCICIAAQHPVLGTVTKLLYVVADGGEVNVKALASFLKTRLEAYKVPMLYSAVDKVQRTYNGKLNRKYYL